MSLYPPLAGRTVVRWGIIGCGAVTEVKSGPGFQLATGSALTAVMRRSGDLARDYAARHKVARWYDSVDGLLRDPEVDAVYIATPPGTHTELAVAVAAAGKPAYVEKPMARNTAECDEMMVAFAAAKLPLFVAYYRRSLPRFLAVRDLIASGVLGSLTEVAYLNEAPHHLSDAGWRVSAESSGGGHFLDVGSHVVDLMDFFLGPLQNVTGDAQRLGPTGIVEDTVSLDFTAGTVAGSARWNFASPNRVDRMEIFGTEGSVRFSVFGDEPLEWQKRDSIEAICRPNPKHVAQPLIQTIVDDLLGRGKCPSTAESARRASRVMDQVLEGFYGGRSDSFWTREKTWPGLASARS